MYVRIFLNLISFVSNVSWSEHNKEEEELSRFCYRVYLGMKPVASKQALISWQALHVSVRRAYVHIWISEAKGWLGHAIVFTASS